MATNYNNGGAVSYDKNTDYTALRDQAAASGDYKAAAQYEAQRNQKIQDLNASGENKWNAQVENKYSQYLDSGSSSKVNDGSRPSYAEDYKNNGAADKYGVDHRYAVEYPVSDADLKKLQQYGNEYNAAAAAKEQALANAKSDAEKAQIESYYTGIMDTAHENAEAIRAKYGYSGGVDGSEFLTNKILGSGGGNGGGGYTIPTVPLLTNRAPDLTDLLDQWLEAAKKEQELKIDYAVNQGVDELNRAKEDAEVQFQTQQNQVDENEAKALDNQALYAEARGDRGGIGQAQYAQIQATAMTNRRTINSARTKLATDTARQIADLRAQGEFQKADAVLELTQTYLSQLIDLEKWGAEFNLDVDKFNSQIQMWQAEFELAVAEVMGQYQGVPTLDREKFEASKDQWDKEFQTAKDQWDKEFNFTTQSAQKENLASSGLAALAVGVRPSAAQQAAMGYTDAQIEAALAAYKLEQVTGSGSSGSSGKGSSSGSSGKSGSSGGSGKSGSSGSTKTPATLDELFETMYAQGLTSQAAAKYYLRQNGYTVSDAADYAEAYMEKYEAGELTPSDLNTVEGRQAEYDKLGTKAKELLSQIQRNNYRNETTGVSSGDQSKLELAVQNGSITEAELDIILNLLGY